LDGLDFSLLLAHVLIYPRKVISPYNYKQSQK